MAQAHINRAIRLGIAFEAVDIGRLYAARHGRCGICRHPVGIEEFSVDHIRPLSKGGTHHEWNLQLAHAACNSRKSSDLPPHMVDR